MTAPGWYPDNTNAGQLRWWDGQQWTAQTAPAPTQTPAFPQPAFAQNAYRPAGPIKLGPSLRTSLSVMAAGLVLAVVGAVFVVPALIRTLDGPQFATPGSTTTHLSSGTWVLYERTGSQGGFGGFNVSTTGPVDIEAHAVSVTGPRPVVTTPDLAHETLTRDSVLYTGAVRFHIATSGDYTVNVTSRGTGEVALGPSLGSIARKWPAFFAFGLGSLVLIAGVVLLIVGTSRRSSAKRAQGRGW